MSAYDRIVEEEAYQAAKKAYKEAKATATGNAEQRRKVKWLAAIRAAMEIFNK